MIRLAYAQRSLVEVLLPDGEKLWDPVLRCIDAELEDEGLLDVMVEALAENSHCQCATSSLILG